MKNLKLITIIAIVSLMVINACKKEETSDPTNTGGTNNNNNNNTSSGTFTATINGVLFSSNKVRSELSANVLQISATSGKAGFAFYLNDPKVGPNTLSQFFPGSFALYTKDTTADQNAFYFSLDNSVLNITSYNTSTQTVVGTFSFTMKDSIGNTVSVTNGSFNIKYAIPVPDGHISYTFDGQTYENDLEVGTGYFHGGPDSTGHIDTTYTVSAHSYDQNYPQITFDVAKYISVGTYDLANPNSGLKAFSVYVTESIDIYYSYNYYPGEVSSGTLTITKNDLNTKTIEGSFAVTASRYDDSTSTEIKKPITNASFHMTYH